MYNIKYIVQDYNTYNIENYNVYTVCTIQTERKREKDRVIKQMWQNVNN